MKLDVNRSEQLPIIVLSGFLPWQASIHFGVSGRKCFLQLRSISVNRCLTFPMRPIRVSLQAKVWLDPRVSLYNTGVTACLVFCSSLINFSPLLRRNGLQERGLRKSAETIEEGTSPVLSWRWPTAIYTPLN